MPSGYYRYPTLHQDTIVFVSEDDLWAVPIGGGVAQRLSSGLGEVTFPIFSPDGQHIAYVGREEGQADVYVMSAQGGPSRRLTYLGGTKYQVVGWTAEGKVIFASNGQQPHNALVYLYTVDLDGGMPERMNVGPARTISYGLDGIVVIGRNTGNPAYWKRYRGGTAGQLWVDAEGDGQFRPLVNVTGNLESPNWIGGRLYFISDHEGVGNLYSCLVTGGDIRRHTDHADFYARNASSDGQKIVYHAGGDLYLFDPVTDSYGRIEVQYRSPQTQRNRKFVAAANYLQSSALHPQGHSLALTVRGKPFTLGNWEGAVWQHGHHDEARYRLLTWLNDGQRLLAVTDANGEEQFVILHADGSVAPEYLSDLDTGRPLGIDINPQKDQIVFSNHRYELCWLDLTTKELKIIDRGSNSRISGYDWSPDGEWVVYSVSINLQVTILKLWQAGTGESYPITTPILYDGSPTFDPQGKYIYFISYRTFNPVYDHIQFDLNFPRAAKPYLITLQKDTPSPFTPEPKPLAGNNTPPKKKDEEKKEGEGEEKKDEAEKKKDEVKKIQIDLEGIQNRIVAFPLDEGRYSAVAGLKEGKLLYSVFPLEGALAQTPVDPNTTGRGTLVMYTLEEQKEEVIMNGITSFNVSRDSTAVLIRVNRRLRVVKAGVKPENGSDTPSRKSGWIDLGRVKASTWPGLEWRQMLREAWRLQRDHFWTEDMSQVDWVRVLDRYLPLVERVASRSEFSDIVWEMQGELGTSHTYEMGGDYRTPPHYAPGYLGADYGYDMATDSWRIEHIVSGDGWDENGDSPLRRPGANIQVGDRIVAVNGRKVNRGFSVAAALVNQAGQEVVLTVARDGEESPRQVTVKTLKSEQPARYREWVERNRAIVHEQTGGRIGYVHIPNMMAQGYAEFHRGYLAEVVRDGLIVDVRYNGGGHVSPLILEKLARRRVGYDQPRWGKDPIPFPYDSVLGPIVALTNEHAGSDGDIFSHTFKLMKIGPLLGKRTWGGVVGISPSHPLADGTMTTQPEYSFWFNDVEWGVENYGTDPDIEVDNTPQDYAQGVDAQLNRAIQEALHLLDTNPPVRPQMGNRPSLALPKLPPRA